MRYLTMIVGLVMIVLAGLWFFTPVLDGAYSRYAPGIAHSHVRSAARAPQSAQSTQAGGTRSAAPSASAPASVQSVTQQIGSKALAENFMSMLNLGSGILGAWFTYMSYRLQMRRRD